MNKWKKWRYLQERPKQVEIVSLLWLPHNSSSQVAFMWLKKPQWNFYPQVANYVRLQFLDSLWTVVIKFCDWVIQRSIPIGEPCLSRLSLFVSITVTVSHIIINYSTVQTSQQYSCMGCFSLCLLLSRPWKKQDWHWSYPRHRRHLYRSPTIGYVRQTPHRTPWLTEIKEM